MRMRSRVLSHNGEWPSLPCPWNDICGQGHGDTRRLEIDRLSPGPDRLRGMRLSPRGQAGSRRVTTTQGLSNTVLVPLDHQVFHGFPMLLQLVVSLLCRSLVADLHQIGTPMFQRPRGHPSALDRALCVSEESFCLRDISKEIGQQCELDQTSWLRGMAVLKPLDIWSQHDQSRFVPT